MALPVGLKLGEIDWERCSEPDCVGVAALDGLCVRHGMVHGADAVAAVLAQQRADGQLDLRGVEIDRELLALATTSGRFEDGRRILGGARFDWASLKADVTLADVRFDKEVGFVGTRFAGRLSLDGVRFADSTSFQGARFQDVVLDGVEFGGSLLFDQAELQGQLLVTGTQFGRVASFRSVTFADVVLTDSRFLRDAILQRCTFGGTLSITRLRFDRDATFSDSRFTGAEIDEMTVLGDLWLDRVTTTEPVTLRAGARSLMIRGAQLGRSVNLELARAEVVLDKTSFAEPSVLTTDPTMDDDELKESCWTRDRPRFERSERARILSLQRANVEKLTLGQVDLRACRFFGAYHLSDLSIEAPDAFAFTPRGGRWSRRQSIAEEQEWQRRPGRGASAWAEGAARVPTSAPPLQPLGPTDIAAIYRSLRKGREEGKDEPGAADFYYGEMEMRRRSRRPAAGSLSETAPKWLAERMILSAYWLVSGYGLRATRALAVLLAVLVVCTPALYLYGFEERDEPFARPAEVQASERLRWPPPADELWDGLTSADAWAYSLGTATSVIGAPESQLTSGGRFLRITLRVLGPLLIALAILAIRARVKR